MRKPHNVAATAALATVLVISTPAFAEPARPRPAQPQVTASAALKRLVFDWDGVPGATHYQLRVNPTGGDGYSPLGDRIPAYRTRASLQVAAHLLDWQRASYVVSACNRAGCRDSAPVFVDDLEADAVGYFKASNTDAGDRLGAGLALSDDGRTMAVTALLESSNASGVDGNQADNSSAGSGAVYVYRRSGTHWRQEAYLKAGVNQPRQFFGYGFPLDQRALAISGDGNLLAVGAPGQRLDGTANSGLVYLFERAGNGTWSLATTLRGPTPAPNPDGGSGDFFGISIDMSLDGRTLKVNSLQPIDEEDRPEGRTHVYVRSAEGWRLGATLAPFHAGDFCPVVRMSGDGRTLVSSCFTQGEPAARVVTLERSGDTWNHVSDLAFDSFSAQQPLALDFGARRMAFKRGTRLSSQLEVYRRTGAAWELEQSIDALTGSPAWGLAVAFDRRGKLLAIADALARPNSGDPLPPGDESEGGVFVYQLDTANANPWQLRSVVGAPNAGALDRFGVSVALSGSGRTLAVGADREDGNARGIDGNREDDSAPDAGAVYLY